MRKLFKHFPLQMKTLSHHRNHENWLYYWESSPTPPIWVELHILLSPCKKEDTHFYWRNQILDSKMSTQEGVSTVPTISPRGPETLTVT